jgi:hypothetical protein
LKCSMFCIPLLSGQGSSWGHLYGGNTPNLSRPGWLGQMFAVCVYKIMCKIMLKFDSLYLCNQALYQTMVKLKIAHFICLDLSLFTLHSNVPLSTAQGG